MADQVRVAAIYERQAERLYRFALSLLGRAAAAEDMVQDCFVKLLRSPVDFAGEAQERAWLLTCVRNACYDFFRRSEEKNVLLDESLVSAADDQWQQVDLRLDTQDLLMALPPELRTICLLYYVEGYSSREIAEFLQCRPSTVRNRLARARQLLREAEEDHA